MSFESAWRLSYTDVNDRFVFCATDRSTNPARVSMIDISLAFPPHTGTVSQDTAGFLLFKNSTSKIID